MRTRKRVSAVTLAPLTPSDFDIRNSASAAVSYEIPSPSEWGGEVAHATLSGWALYGVWRISSGPPLDVLMDTIIPTVGLIGPVRPVLTGQAIWIPDKTQPAGKALNPDAFTLPPNAVSNDALRNSIRSPYGINQIDSALSRRFNITDRVKLDFRAEYFNILNHPMFGGGSGGITHAPETVWGFCASQPCAGQQYPFFGKVLPPYTLNVGLGGGGPNGGQSAIYAIGGNLTLRLILFRIHHSFGIDADFNELCGQSFGERPGCAAGPSHITRRVHARGTHDSRSATIGSTLVARQAGM